jgi:membrane protease YdiL (CAAX protease family)
MGPESVSPPDAFETGGGVERIVSSPDPSRSESVKAQMATGQPDDLNWVFFGSHGLRAGWSILVFAFLLYFSLNLFQLMLALVVVDGLHLRVYPGTPLITILGEGVRVAALLVSVAVVAVLERRRLTDYNLAESNGLQHLLGGLVAGFCALSALIAVLSACGWMRVGPVALAGPQIFKYALLWGIGFALVGIFEEGAFRCYLLYTFTRGVNFWWALASVGSVCVYLMLNPRAHGAWGVYAVALAGLLPCLWLQMSRTARGAFWEAAWVTSVGFGFIHTLNNGENAIGILAAAAIGFVFCVSVRVTGSAWWAIGCHASWDWAESYFYGTADSGFSAQGHLFTTTASGPALWSGGSDGPEGSLLVFLVILLLLVALLVIYGRRNHAPLERQASERLAG